VTVAAATSPVDQPLPTVRRARWFLVGLHLALVAVAPVFTIAGFEGDAGNPAMAVLAALAIGALQLRHSFAAARGERPRGWPWTLLALTVLVYLPMTWFAMDWAPMQYFVIASGAMLLRGWPAGIAVAAPLLATATRVVGEAPVNGESVAQEVLAVAYWIVGLVTGAVALYGSARLVQILDELEATRTELAELAVGRERLRVSRDLHDLLGQSLSAVSLKGDLALRLLHSDPLAARAEIASLTEVARDTLRGVRAVTRGEHEVSLRTETKGAVALLSAAGIDARIDLDLSDLPAPVEHLLAWAVREGVTNVLRHSQATTCSITAGRRHASTFLEVVNDGARGATAGEGSGLAGLTERAGALTGSVTAGPVGDGRFRLLVEVPKEIQ
jgi:two-component system, NarL family, sensor histidine kinase DesK